MIMKSLELQPTDENIIKAYVKDSIGRNVYLHWFVDMLNSIDDSCTIALDGTWGSGKTFFVKQVEMILNAYHPQRGAALYGEEKVFEIKNVRRDSGGAVGALIPIYFDAWENDYHENPLFSLIYVILKETHTGNDLSRVEPQLFEFMDALAKLLSHGEVSLKEWKNCFKKENFLSSLKREQDLHTQIAEFFKTLHQETGGRLIIFIDELDRCRPDFTVKFLEQIKHYCCCDGIMFVLSTNLLELQYTVRRFYGEGFDAEQYLDRFLDLRCSIPQPDLKRYLRGLGVTLDHSNFYDVGIKSVAEYFELSLRQIAKLVRAIRIATFKMTHTQNMSYKACVDICVYLIIPVMIGLKLKNTEQYQNFVSGGDAELLADFAEKNPDFCDALCEKLLNKDESFWGNSGFKRVTCGDKLRELYSKLFDTTEMKECSHSFIIGQCEFYSSLRQTVADTANLLSELADYGNKR